MKRMCSGVCWFAAACLSVVAFILVLAGIALNAGVHWSPTGFVLTLLAGAAFVVMVALMATAFRNERRDDGNGTSSGSP
jgi:membrane protein implicated in regulation of membrane protease activity